MVKISFVVTEMTGYNNVFGGQDHFCNFQSGCGRFLCGQDHFVVAEIAFKVAAITSSLANITLLWLG